jgi:MFS family permease
MGTLLVVVYVHHSFLSNHHSHRALDGRRIIYLVSLPIFIGGSVGAALSQSFGVLVGFRILQVSLWSD